MCKECGNILHSKALDAAFADDRDQRGERLKAWLALTDDERELSNIEDDLKRFADAPIHVRSLNMRKAAIAGAKRSTTMFTAQDAHDEGWSKMPAYLDGHCAGFNGWPWEKLADVAGQAYDRGYEVGLRARDAMTKKEVTYGSLGQAGPCWPGERPKP